MRKNFFNSKYFVFLTAGFAIVAILYLTMRLLMPEHISLGGLFSIVTSKYLLTAEGVVNFILAISGSEVFLENHKIVFPEITGYVTKNLVIIENWVDYVLFKKWVVAILAVVWLTFTNIKKKLIYSGLLLVIHFIALTSGLLLITLYGPAYVNPDSLSELRPNSVGSILMILLLFAWIKQNETEVISSLGKIRIKLTFSRKKINEILIVFLIYSIIKNFIVPYFNFYPYIQFLLSVTRLVVGIFGFEATIDGPYLIGNGGTLFMAKWCLGFLTMFVFASGIYLTGVNKKQVWVYIILGVLFLHLLNIVRLAVLYIFVQSHDSQLAHNHHAIYNIVFYSIIFILWIFWFEKYAGLNIKKKL